MNAIVTTVYASRSNNITAFARILTIVKSSDQPLNTGLEKMLN